MGSCSTRLSHVICDHVAARGQHVAFLSDVYFIIQMSPGCMKCVICVEAYRVSDVWQQHCPTGSIKVRSTWHGCCHETTTVNAQAEAALGKATGDAGHAVAHLCPSLVVSGHYLAGETNMFCGEDDCQLSEMASGALQPACHAHFRGIEKVSLDDHAYVHTRGLACSSDALVML